LGCLFHMSNIEDGHSRMGRLPVLMVDRFFWRTVIILRTCPVSWRTDESCMQQIKLTAQSRSIDRMVGRSLVKLKMWSRGVTFWMSGASRVQYAWQWLDLATCTLQMYEPSATTTKRPPPNPLPGVVIGLCGWDTLIWLPVLVFELPLRSGRGSFWGR